MKIVFVACSRNKSPCPMLAQDLYVSAWFRRARQYAERYGDAWYVLSAKHGLVLPTDEIAPYNQSLYTKPAAKRREWAAHVFAQIRKRHRQPQVAVLLAGETYREHLAVLLRIAGWEIEQPLAHLGIGRQLAWLRQQTNKPLEHLYDE